MLPSLFRAIADLLKTTSCGLMITVTGALLYFSLFWSQRSKGKQAILLGGKEPGTSSIDAPTETSKQPPQSPLLLVCCTEDFLTVAPVPLALQSEQPELLAVREWRRLTDLRTEMTNRRPRSRLRDDTEARMRQGLADCKDWLLSARQTDAGRPRLCILGTGEQATTLAGWLRLACRDMPALADLDPIISRIAV